MLRTHTCGELSAENLDLEVALCGWVDTYRDHGGGLFIDLRDRYGLTQAVFGPDTADEVMGLARKLRGETVVRIEGVVARRPEGNENPKLPTGAIEVRVKSVEILNESLTPPFQLDASEEDGDLAGEDLRLKYRYLDLRRSTMQQTMLLRHRGRSTAKTTHRRISTVGASHIAFTQART